MSMETIPTPETDALDNLMFSTTHLFSKCRNLERRLTVARDALRLVASNVQDYGPFWAQGDIQNSVRESLTQTAPKP